MGAPLSCRRPVGGSVSTELKALGAAIDGAVVTGEDEAYEALRKPSVRQAEDVRPLAIVRCCSAEDVAHALAVARRLRVPVVPRSGGHCLAGRSTTAGIVLDVAPMRTVVVSDEISIVGAGVRLGALYDALDGHGRAVPAGCGPTVGIAGLTLGGGIGILGRRHGLTCDRLRAAQVVLADGRIVACDAERHGDLFWALRGGGGGRFGVVTSLELRTVPAPGTTTFDLQWETSRAATAIAAWQRWAPDAPDHVDATLHVIAPDRSVGPSTVRLVGAIHDARDSAERLLDEVVGRIGDPRGAVVQHGPFRTAKRWLAERVEAPEDADAVPVTTTELFDRDLPPAVVTALLRDLTAGPSRRMTFTPLGGAYNRIPPTATAFAHRRQRFMLEHSTSAPPARLPAARAWARTAWTTAHPAGTGRVYPNFPDRGLPDATSAYHGENVLRLREIKRRYDPENTFTFPQSI